MLTDIQAMIVDYKKKQNYSNLVTNHDSEDNLNLPTNPDTAQEEHTHTTANLPNLKATSQTNRVFEA